MEFYAKVYYEYYHDKRLDLSNPIEFNQKLQWLKVYFHPPILNILADKYAVRKYVKDKIGGEYLNEIYGVYEESSEVDYEKLPDRFILKATHGCNMNILVKDRANFNRTRAKLAMSKWKKTNMFYTTGQEWVYKNIKPRIIAEKILEEKGKNVLTDYKFFCFGGKPKFVKVIMDSDKNDHRPYFDMEWNKLPFSTLQNKSGNEKLEKPVNFDEMKECAEKLADKLPFVRVDFYLIEGKVLFGEMTFYPTDNRESFYPDKYNKIVGDYIHLPKLPVGQKEIVLK
jgi:hypothetical protein